MSHLNFWILATSTNFCLIKTDLSGNTVWLQALEFKNSPKWTIFGIFVHSKCIRSSLRSQCPMRLFLWFSNTVARVHNPITSRGLQHITKNRWLWTYLSLLGSSIRTIIFRVFLDMLKVSLKKVVSKEMVFCQEKVLVQFDPPFWTFAVSKGFFFMF